MTAQVLDRHSCERSCCVAGETSAAADGLVEGVDNMCMWKRTTREELQEVSQGSGLNKTFVALRWLNYFLTLVVARRCVFCWRQVCERSSEVEIWFPIAKRNRSIASTNSLMT